MYAIHRCNEEIIHLLEEKLTFPDNLIEQILIKSIKCHHNSITEYIINNHLKKPQSLQKNVLLKIFKYFNFTFIDDKDLNSSIFYDLCRYDYSTFVEELIKSTDADVNKSRLVKLNSSSSEKDPKK